MGQREGKEFPKQEKNYKGLFWRQETRYGEYEKANWIYLSWRMGWRGRLMHDNVGEISWRKWGPRCYLWASITRVKITSDKTKNDSSVRQSFQNKQREVQSTLVSSKATSPMGLALLETSAVIINKLL